MRTTCSLLLASFLLAAFSRADVLTVDDDGGADFTDIQSAVNAALDGDVILVKDGTYPGFLINDKALSVVGLEGETVTLTSGVTVLFLDASRDVTLIRLVVNGSHAGQPHGLDVTQCDGRVRALNCVFVGAVADPDACNYYYYLTGYGGICFFYQGWEGLWISKSEHVALAGCVVRGGDGLPASAQLLFPLAAGGGAWVEEGSLSMYNCVVEGAHGVNSVGPSIGARGVGGRGLVVEGENSIHDETLVFASGSIVRGGDGGDAPAPGATASDGGLAFSISKAADAVLIGSTLESGEGGTADVPGMPGADPFVAGSSTITELPFTPRTLAGAVPVVDGDTLKLTYQGETGDLAVLAISAQPDVVESPLFAGTLLVGAGLLRVQGVIGPSGELVRNISLNVLAPGEESLTVYLQGIFVDGVPNVITGSFKDVVILAPGL